MDLDVKAFVGNLEVIGNGIVHANSDQPLNLLIGGALEMTFEFKTDNENKEFQTRYRVENNQWIWELINYNNSLGTGVIRPINIGNLKDRRLFASFFIWTPNPNENNRIINYVIYLEKES